MPSSSTLQQLSPRYLFAHRRPRDRQRTRVYRWETIAQKETAASANAYPDFAELPAIQAWVHPIWRAERGRYGLAKAPAPTIERPHWGQHRALAYVERGRITLPRWARTPWLVLHELAHHLTPADEAHGSRFVGVLIGLLARHTGRCPEQLLELAHAHGVRVDMRSVGAVPQRELGTRDRLLALLPATDMDLACELGLHWRQVRGLALGLSKQGLVRWYRGKLVRLEARP